MKENIYTIPLNDLFSEKCGCPLCRLDLMIKKRYGEFIMGPAMMSPEIRIETNRLGFCREHYSSLMKFNNKLSLALMTQTRMDSLSEVLSEKRPDIKKYREKTKSCYLCEKEKASRGQIYDNIIVTFRKDSEFRTLFSEQEFICMPHFAKICEKAYISLSKRDYLLFSETAAELCRKGFERVKKNIDHFCYMFDYRNQSEDADWGDARDALDQAFKYLNKE